MERSDKNVDTSEMIVKRVSVPVGLEELMEGLAKEVLLKQPADIYLFAAKHFSKLLLLREEGNYKVKSIRSAQTIAEQNRRWSDKKFLTQETAKCLPRQISVRTETKTKNAATKIPQPGKDSKDKSPAKKENLEESSPKSELSMEGKQKYMYSKSGLRSMSTERPRNIHYRERSQSSTERARIVKPVTDQKKTRANKPGKMRSVSIDGGRSPRTLDLSRIKTGEKTTGSADNEKVINDSQMKLVKNIEKTNMECVDDLKASSGVVSNIHTLDQRTNEEKNQNVKNVQGPLDDSKLRDQLLETVLSQDSLETASNNNTPTTANDEQEKGLSTPLLEKEVKERSTTDDSAELHSEYNVDPTGHTKELVGLKSGEDNNYDNVENISIQMDTRKIVDNSDNGESGMKKGVEPSGKVDSLNVDDVKKQADAHIIVNDSGIEESGAKEAVASLEQVEKLVDSKPNEENNVKMNIDMKQKLDPPNIVDDSVKLTATADKSVEIRSEEESNMTIDKDVNKQSSGFGADMPAIVDEKIDVDISKKLLNATNSAVEFPDVENFEAKSTVPVEVGDLGQHSPTNKELTIDNSSITSNGHIDNQQDSQNNLSGKPMLTHSTNQIDSIEETGLSTKLKSEYSRTNVSQNAVDNRLVTTQAKEDTLNDTTGELLNEKSNEKAEKMVVDTNNVNNIKLDHEKTPGSSQNQSINDRIENNSRNDLTEISTKGEPEAEQYLITHKETENVSEEEKSRITDLGNDSELIPTEKEENKISEIRKVENDVKNDFITALVHKTQEKDDQESKLSKLSKLSSNENEPDNEIDEKVLNKNEKVNISNKQDDTLIKVDIVGNEIKKVNDEKQNIEEKREMLINKELCIEKSDSSSKDDNLVEEKDFRTELEKQFSNETMDTGKDIIDKGKHTNSLLKKHEYLISDDVAKGTDHQSGKTSITEGENISNKRDDIVTKVGIVAGNEIERVNDEKQNIEEKREIPITKEMCIEKADSSSKDDNVLEKNDYWTELEKQFSSETLGKDAIDKGEHTDTPLKEHESLISDDVAKGTDHQSIETSIKEDISSDKSNKLKCSGSNNISEQNIDIGKTHIGTVTQEFIENEKCKSINSETEEQINPENTVKEIQKKPLEMIADQTADNTENGTCDENKSKSLSANINVEAMKAPLDSTKEVQISKTKDTDGNKEQREEITDKAQGSREVSDKQIVSPILSAKDMSNTSQQNSLSSNEKVQFFVGDDELIVVGHSDSRKKEKEPENNTKDEESRRVDNIKRVQVHNDDQKQQLVKNDTIERDESDLESLGNESINNEDTINEVPSLTENSKSDNIISSKQQSSGLFSATEDEEIAKKILGKVLLRELSQKSVCTSNNDETSTESHEKSDHRRRKRSASISDHNEKSTVSHLDNKEKVSGKQKSENENPLGENKDSKVVSFETKSERELNKTETERANVEKREILPTESKESDSIPVSTTVSNSQQISSSSDGSDNCDSNNNTKYPKINEIILSEHVKSVSSESITPISNQELAKNDNSNNNTKNARITEMTPLEHVKSVSSESISTTSNQKLPKTDKSNNNTKHAEINEIIPAEHVKSASSESITTISNQELSKNDESNNNTKNTKINEIIPAEHMKSVSSESITTTSNQEQPKNDNSDNSGKSQSQNKPDISKSQQISTDSKSLYLSASESKSMDCKRTTHSEDIDMEAINATIAVLKTGVLNRVAKNCMNNFINKEKHANNILDSRQSNEAPLKSLSKSDEGTKERVNFELKRGTEDTSLKEDDLNSEASLKYQTTGKQDNVSESCDKRIVEEQDKKPGINANAVVKNSPEANESPTIQLDMSKLTEDMNTSANHAKSTNFSNSSELFKLNGHIKNVGNNLTDSKNPYNSNKIMNTTLAIVRIQSLWRGFIVRKSLSGPKANNRRKFFYSVGSIPSNESEMAEMKRNVENLVQAKLIAEEKQKKLEGNKDTEFSNQNTRMKSTEEPNNVISETPIRPKSIESNDSVVTVIHNEVTGENLEDADHKHDSDEECSHLSNNINEIDAIQNKLLEKIAGKTVGTDTNLDTLLASAALDDIALEDEMDLNMLHQHKDFEDSKSGNLSPIAEHQEVIREDDTGSKPSPDNKKASVEPEPNISMNLNNKNYLENLGKSKSLDAQIFSKSSEKEKDKDPLSESALSQIKGTHCETITKKEYQNESLKHTKPPKSPSHLLHTGEMHDTIVVSLGRIGTKSEMESAAKEGQNGSVKKIENPQVSLKPVGLMHTSELHDSIILPFIEENLRNDVGSKDEGVGKDFVKTVESSNNVMKNDGLAHTGELHDVVPLPLAGTGIKTQREQMVKEVEDNTSKVMEASRKMYESSGLKHTGEFHDSFVQPLETFQNGDTFTEDNAANRKSITCVVSSPLPTTVGIDAQTSVKPGLETSTADEKLNSESNVVARCSMENKKSSKEAHTVKPNQEDKEMEAKAATKIQAGFRGYQVRKQLKVKNGSSDMHNTQRRPSRSKNVSRLDNSKPKEVEEESAIKIQAGIRGFLVRRRQKKHQGNQDTK